jgi:predicted small lipoprotein YifL
MAPLQRIVPSLLIGLALAGCGQKGPLYLEQPEPPPQPATASKKPAKPAATPSEPADHTPAQRSQY